MQQALRAIGVLLMSAWVICAASGDPPDEIPTAKRSGLTRAVELKPGGLTLTPRQYAQYRKALVDLERATPDAQAFAGAASASQAALTAPLLPPIWIDAGDTAVEAIAVGDVTGDSLTDVVAFGPRASPNQTERQLTVYAQTADGVLDAPIHSAVSSQHGVRPGGFVIRPVLGTRPNIVAWGQFWIEIYSLASDGSASPTPVTIAPGFAILDVVIRDLNSDGRPDLIVSGTDTNDASMPTVIRRYLQTTSATFTAGSTVVLPFTDYGVDGVLADIQGDGIVDEIDGVSGASFGFLYRTGLADGTFGPAVTVLETTADFTLVSGVRVRDVDADGLPDVVLATLTGARVRFQTAPGVFTTVQLPASGGLNNVFHVSIGDLDGNGLLDAITWIDGYDAMYVALQTAPRVFTDAGHYGVPDADHRLPSFYEDTTLIADVNSDAKADLLVVTSGLAAFYNSTGSYPVLDARISSTAQVDDGGPVAYVQWQHQVVNAGPATLVDSLLLQNIPEGYELSATSVPCAYFVTLVVCEVPSVPAGSSTTVLIEAESIAARYQDLGAHAEVFLSVGDRPIDTVPDNNAAAIAATVRGNAEGLQAAGDEVFVYESAGSTVIPVVNSPGTSSLARCMNYWIGGNNLPDGTGIAGAINGYVCTAPGQQGQGRIRVGLRDGATANAALRHDVAFSTGGFSAPGTQIMTIVDDDGGDPKLTSAGTRPFEEWPAVFSSVATVIETFSGSPRAATIGDLDGDGRNDLAISFSELGVQPSSVLVWLQRPDGTLSPTPLEWSGSFSGTIASLAIGDVIGDGAAELVVPLATELDFLRLVNGQLQRVSAVGVDAWQIAVRDLNGDGYDDIVAADGDIQSFDGPQYWVPNVTVFRGNAQRTLDGAPYELAMPYAGRNELVLGRFNDDALLDIAISSGQGNFPSVSIARQRQDGTFAAPVGVWVAGPMHLDGLGFGDTLAAGDFDGDGKTDLAIGSYVREGAPSVWIYTDLRDDDFASPSQRLYVGAEGNLGILDINQDGREDLLVDSAVFPGFPGSPMKVFVQDSGRRLRTAGTLAESGSGQHDKWIQKIAVGDLDGDDQEDAVIINYYSGIVHLAHSAATRPIVQLTTLESNDVAARTRARYRVRITYNGARRSPEIPLGWTLPAQLASPQIVAAKGACYVSAAKAQCLLPQIEPGGHVDVMLTGTFTAGGTYPTSVSAGPDGAFGNLALSVTVTAASGGASSGGGTGGGGSTGAGGSPSGGGGGGGGALGWLNVCALLAVALVRQSSRSLLPRRERRLA